jgi:hypothetical protein
MPNFDHNSERVDFERHSKVIGDDHETGWSDPERIAHALLVPDAFILFGAAHCLEIAECATNALKSAKARGDAPETGIGIALKDQTTSPPWL